MVVVVRWGGSGSGSGSDLETTIMREERRENREREREREGGRESERERDYVHAAINLAMHVFYRRGHHHPSRQSTNASTRHVRGILGSGNGNGNGPGEILGHAGSCCFDGERETRIAILTSLQWRQSIVVAQTY